MKGGKAENHNVTGFTNAFFNIYKEGENTCIESDCENIFSLHERHGFQGEVQSLGDICRVCSPQYTVEKIVHLLEDIGVKKSRIAIDNVPVEVDVDTVFSKKPVVLACPRCGSTEISIVNVAGLMPPLYRCLKCGYIGRIVLEIVVDED